MGEQRGPRLELTWPNKEKFLLVPKDDDGKPVWVERDHPAASEVRLSDFTDAVGDVNDTDPYEGWDKSIYEINAFDAYSTEFRLAGLYESSPEVGAWVRIDQTVPLRIPYLIGAVQRQYEPDFIVIDTTGTYWIVEGKADSEMTSPVVTAKRDAARAWINTVNASDSVHDKWGYLLASESVIKNASTWAALKAGGQVYQ